MEYGLPARAKKEVSGMAVLEATSREHCRENMIVAVSCQEEDRYVDVEDGRASRGSGRIDPTPTDACRHVTHD